MKNFVLRNWFLAGLCIVIPAGLVIGYQATPERLAELIGWVSSRALTAIVLFLMALTLDSGRFQESLRSPGPVLWASLVNYGLLPLFGWFAHSFQHSADFQIGLIIAASVPCTMASASVWTRKAGGNDAVSLLVTMLTNGLCFVITPMWIAFGTQVTTELSISQMIVRLAVSVLLPCALGQLFRMKASVAQTATTHKKRLGVSAQSLILFMVFIAACRSGNKLQIGDGGPDWFATAFVWLSCIVLHVVALAIGFYGARLFGFSRADQKAVAFASSQKTLPIGVLLAGQFPNAPFAIFPMLMFHASQLFIDTVIASKLNDDSGSDDLRSDDGKQRRSG